MPHSATRNRKTELFADFLAIRHGHYSLKIRVLRHCCPARKEL
jgi:hypothetical protein